MEKSKLYFLGNISFGIMSIIFWTLYVTTPYVDITYPLTLNSIQFIFLLLQYFDGRTN